ncbi:MmgE/PrpD family protein [Devosia sp. CAU 1758]
MTLSRQIVDAYWSVDRLDRPIIEAARIALADGLGVMAAAVSLEPATAPFLDHAMAMGGSGPARIIGRGCSVTAPMAALANGALAHALDFEDTFEAGMIHPNASLIPAVLSLAQMEASDGPRVLKSLALGCDFACRLSLALDGDPAQRGWYHPPILSGLGATLGAAYLLGLTGQQAVDALGLFIAQFMLGDELKRSPRSHLRAVRESLAARAAVESVLLARAGVRAVEQPLEGRSGVFAQLTRNGPLEQALLDSLGVHFAGPSVAVKRWPSCRGTHSAIVAAQTFRRKGVLAGSIARVDVTATPPNDMLFLPRQSRIAPATSIDAKFSIPYVFAAAMTRDTVDLGAFAEAVRGDAAILDLARKVEMRELVTSAGFEARYEIALLDGTRLVETVIAVPEWRTADMQLTDLAPKLGNCLGIVGVDVGAFLDAVRSIETNGVAPLIEFL